MQKKSSLKPFYLSLSKWRCGEKGPNKIGDGSTMLLNQEGFMCCLGQGVKQFDASADIRGRFYPPSSGTKYPLFVKDDESTIFSLDAVGINDDEDLTTEERVVALEFLLQGEGYRLMVVN